MKLYEYPFSNSLLTKQSIITHCNIVYQYSRSSSSTNSSLDDLLSVLVYFPMAHIRVHMVLAYAMHISLLSYLSTLCVHLSHDHTLFPGWAHTSKSQMCLLGVQGVELITWTSKDHTKMYVTLPGEPHFVVFFQRTRYVWVEFTHPIAKCVWWNCKVWWSVLMFAEKSFLGN